MLLLVFTNCVSVRVNTTSSPDPGVRGELAERAIDTRITRDVRGQYLIYLPKNYDPSQRWPLLLFLHGAGERGDDLSRVAIHGPPRVIREATMDMPFIVVAPQLPADRVWSVQFLDALLDEVQRAHAVDEDRVYVTGLSMGGYGTWALAFEFPHRFAAIAPISGGGVITGPCTIPHLPVWVFHGVQDQVVPVHHSDELVARLRTCDGHVRYSRYDDAGHDAWTRTYANPDLYAWLLSHRRGAPAPKDPQEQP